MTYSKERKQFGRPIASFQLVQEMIARHGRARPRPHARWCWRAGWLKDTGKPNTTETSIAKLYATEAAVECANLAIQVHGGSGYVDDYPVERYLRDARVTTLYEGTSQIQKLIIGRARHRRQRDGLMGGVHAEIRGAVGVAQLDRPEARNALSPELMAELVDCSRAGMQIPRSAAS